MPHKHLDWLCMWSRSSAPSTVHHTKAWETKAANQHRKLLGYFNLRQLHLKVASSIKGKGQLQFYNEIKVSNIAYGKNDTMKDSLHFATNSRSRSVSVTLDFLGEKVFPTTLWETQDVRD